MPASAPVPAAVTLDAGQAPVVAAAMPAELLVRPPVGGAGALLFLGATARLSGISITFAKSNHEVVVGSAGGTGMFDFQFVKGGTKSDVRLRSDEEKFQAEVVVHGALFVFEQRSEDMFTVMLAAASAPVRLEDDGCVALIDEAAKRAGITDGRSSASGTDGGILRLRRQSWTAYCGRYTKRVWFAPLP